MLVPAENRTVPSPWPCAGEPMLNHDASVFAVHWQSRFAVMRTEPEPPVAGNEGLSAVACRAHLVDDGAVRLWVCEEEPQAAATKAPTISVVNAANEREGLRRPVATVVDAPEPDAAGASHMPKSSV